MEAIYLVWSIITTSLTSLTLSLLLPLRLILHRLKSCIEEEDYRYVSIYKGTVWHERRRPVQHSFSYDARYALFDLDHHSPPSPHHLSASEARSLSGTLGPVFLLTIPPSVGYEQNPLSLYYCYELEESTKNLKKCIAEVTNTPWGEKVLFLFNPNSDLVAKALHVSPFMALKLWWKGVPFVQHPRYSDPEYKQEALVRDSKLPCMSSQMYDLDSVNSEKINRCFKWKDAKWPWS